MKKIVLAMFLAISIFMAPLPAFASVPRWSYQRGSINNLNFCSLPQAEMLAQGALTDVGFRNVRSSGQGNILGNTDDVMALLFITDYSPGKRGVVLFTTGNGAEDYRKNIWSRLGAGVLIDCGVNGNPVSR